jgi:hypothetical protein
MRWAISSTGSTAYLLVGISTHSWLLARNAASNLRRFWLGTASAIKVPGRGLKSLNDWYGANVLASPLERSRLSPRWYAVGLDIGLYIGDAIIERAPGIKWRLFTHGRKELQL